MDAEEEEAAGKKVGQVCSKLAVVLLLLVVVAGSVGAAMPWWSGNKDQSLVETGSTSVDYTISLWEVKMTVLVAKSPDDPTKIEQKVEHTWDKLCDMVENQRDPATCAKIKMMRAFSILVTILAFLGAAAVLVSSFLDPLVLVLGSALEFFSGICGAAAMIAGVTLSSRDMAGLGAIMTFLSTVLSFAAFVFTMFAATKAMPLPKGNAFEMEAGMPRELRAQVARQQAQEQADRLEKVARGRSREEVGQGGGARQGAEEAAKGEEDPAAKYVNLRRVLFWSETHGTDEAEQIPDWMLEKAFQEMDDDGSGEIGEDEFADALQSCGLKASKAALKAIMKGIDTNESGDIDVHEFVAFFRKTEELARFSKKNEQRAQFLTICCNCSFLFLLVTVGALLMVVVNADSGEDGDDQNYTMLQNLLVACSIALGVLFAFVVAIPALRLTLGPNIVAWQAHYYKKYGQLGRKGNKPGTMEYKCDYECGFRGTIEEVTAHELTCAKRDPSKVRNGPRVAVMKSDRDLRAAAWGNAVPKEPDTINTAVFSGSYRMRKIQEMEMQECAYGCGFISRAQDVIDHERVCPVRIQAEAQGRKVSKISIRSAAAALGPQAPPGVVVDEDGNFAGYDANAMSFGQARMQYMQQEPAATFNGLGARPPNAVQTPAPGAGMMAIADARY